MEEFVVGFKRNREYGSLLALNLVLEGAGAATFLGALLLGYVTGVILGLILVLLGILALFLDLGHPYKFWRVIQRTRSAWISRGTIFVCCLFVFAILYLLFPSLQGTPAGIFIQICAAIFAVLTILYSGFLLSSMTAIPFWNTPLTPILFLLHSATTGLAILIFLLANSTGENPGNGIFELMFGLVGITLSFTIIHIAVMATSINAARESVRLLMSTGLRWSFMGGAVALGMLSPLFIYIYSYFNNGQPLQSLMILVSVAMVLRVIGDYAFRSSVLNAGVFEMMI